MRQNEVAWSEDVMFREAARWAWWPENAIVLEDRRRLMVHMPEHYGKSIVHRSSVTEGEAARNLIEEAIEEARAAGRKKLVSPWPPTARSVAG